MSTLGSKKGSKGMLKQRTRLAIVASTIVRCLFVAFTIFVTQSCADLTSWFQDSQNTNKNFQTWSYFFVLQAITLLQEIVCRNRYLAGPSYPTSRFLRLQGLLTIENLLIQLLYMTVGGVLVWMHLLPEQGRYSSPVKNCDTLLGICLVEEYYFLLLGGLWAGVYFFCKTCLLNTNYPTFTAIPQSKFFQFRRGIYSMMPSAMINSLQSTLYFTVLYYFVGSKFRSIVLCFKPVQIESEPLDSLSGLLNLSLIVHLWLYHLIYALSIGSMYLWFKVFLTEWAPFEIRQTGVFETATPNLSLSEAMSMNDAPILQHLGYLDLFVVAQKDKARRRILFTLSEPGGYPYNWNCMAENCINLLKKFADNLNEALRRSKEQRSRYALLSSSSPCSPPPQPPPAPVSAPLNITFVANEHLRQRACVYRMRNLITTEESSPNTPKDHRPQPSTARPSQNESFAQKFLNGIWQIVATSAPYRMSRRILAYAFDELEDNKIRYLLLNGQTVLWCAEAISSLSVLSLEEDAYGIAQRDLSSIINTLLQVKQSLDKLHRSNLLPRKQQGEDKIVRQMFSSLRSATKRSIYRITTNFNSYIGDLSLEPITVEQLHNFLQYKE